MSAAQNGQVDKPITAYSFFAKLKALAFIEAIYLYGSRAQGDTNPRADIDLAIYCIGATEEDWKKVDAVLEDADTLLRVDAIRLDRNPPRFAVDPLLLDHATLLYYKPYAEGTLLRGRCNIVYDKFQKSSAQLAALQHETALLAGIANPAGHEYAQKEKVVLFLFYETYQALFLAYRAALRLHGLRATSPLAVWREAYMQGWLENRAAWEAMIEDMLVLSEKPDDAQRRELLARLPGYRTELTSATHRLRDILAPYYDSPLPAAGAR